MGQAVYLTLKPLARKILEYRGKSDAPHPLRVVWPLYVPFLAQQSPLARNSGYYSVELNKSREGTRPPPPRPQVLLWLFPWDWLFSALNVRLMNITTWD